MIEYLCMQSFVVKFARHINVSARKMCTNASKGVPLNEIYRGFGKWDLDHLPPIVNKRDHIVLFQLPIDKDSKEPPKPHISETKWDANHVRLPCASQNEYKTESSVSK